MEKEHIKKNNDDDIKSNVKQKEETLQVLQNEKIVAVANKYKSLYFLDEEFKNLPEDIKNELKVALVLGCERCNAVVKLFFNKAGDLRLEILKDEDDYNFDEINAKLVLRDIEEKEKELFQKIELYYKAKNGLIKIE